MVRFPWAFLVMAGLVHANRDGVTATYRAQLDKSRFLRQVAPMIFSGSIPRDGIDRNTTFHRTHYDFAAMMGYSWSESYTRNGRKAPKLVERTLRQAIKGAVYSFAFKEGEARYGANDFTMPTPKELQADEKWKQYWRNVRGKYAGYVQVPAWILDPHTPGTPYEKLVLIALASFGLFKLDSNGHCKGEIQESLETIGARVGIGKDAVRYALDSYEALGLLQVKHHPARPEINGKECPAGTAGSSFRQPPNTIYYVAGREFDEDKAATEMDRFLTAARPIRDLPWFDVAATLHAGVLREWVGTRQLARTLHAECRRRMNNSGVPQKIIDILFPKKPPN